MYMDTDKTRRGTSESATFTPALPGVLDSLFHELWTCGSCGREFGDCTSCGAHEQQCGGRLSRW
jgi:hypothetical protein